jgi:hypothetical protein
MGNHPQIARERRKSRNLETISRLLPIEALFRPIPTCPEKPTQLSIGSCTPSPSRMTSASLYPRFLRARQLFLSLLSGLPRQLDPNPPTLTRIPENPTLSLQREEGLPRQSEITKQILLFGSGPYFRRITKAVPTFPTFRAAR